VVKVRVCLQVPGRTLACVAVSGCRRADGTSDTFDVGPAIVCACVAVMLGWRCRGRCSGNGGGGSGRDIGGGAGGRGGRDVRCFAQMP
jgi:hypothetical protein